MSKIWPFAFFPGMNSSDTPKEEEAPAAESVVEEVPAAEEVVEPVEAAEDEAENKSLPEDEVDSFEEEAETSETDGDEEDDETLPEFEEGLEIALEEAHKEAVKRHRAQNKVVAGLALLGAVGLATGFGIRAYLKRR